MSELYRYIIDHDNEVDVRQSLFSGQSFLWDYHLDHGNFYSTVLGSSPFIIRELSHNKFEVSTTLQELNGLLITDFIRHYFTLDIKINDLFPDRFSGFYPELWPLLENYFPVRILRQDPFETLISFMCAQGIGMHLIRKQVSMLRHTYGEKRVVTFSGRELTLYDFPTAERLASADPAALSICTNNNRLRAGNIILAAQAVVEGRIDFNYLCNRDLPLPELRTLLCQNPGIGYKIADCIALFGLGRFDAFPIDTHVRQYLAKWFNCPTAHRSLTPASYLVLDREARAVLNSDFAGYAGHILFHCWRKEIKKLHSF